MIKIIRKIRIRLARNSDQRVGLIRKYYGVKIGNNCEIHGNVSFGSEPYLISLGNFVRVTSGVKFVNHDGGIWVLRNTNKAINADIFGTITVGDNVHIGVDSIIMPGVKIGSNVIVGAGSIVTKDIADNSVVVGVPAKYIKSIDEYYDKNSSRFVFTKNLSQKEKRIILTDMFK